MAKRKKSSKKKSRKRGMGSMASGSAMEKAALFLTSVAAANLADEGMEMLYATDFMKVTVVEGKPAPKINIKKAGASGSAFALSGLAAAKLSNKWLSAAATGVGVTASKYLKDDLVKPVLGMGAVSDFLNLYKKDMKGMKEVQLAGDRQVQLAGEIKIA